MKTSVAQVRINHGDETPTDEVLQALDSLIDNALSTPGVLDDFGEVSVGTLQEIETGGPFVAAAQQLRQEDGVLEIDDDAEVSRSDQGAYVSAWVWIGNEEAGVKQ